MDTPSVIFYEHNFDDSIKTSLVKNVLNLGNECRALSQENTRLKAEVEELTGLLKASTYYNSSEELTRLEAEVERLTKAGDAMAEEIALAKRQDEGSRFDPIEMHYDHELIVKWNAAKEGKQ